MSIPFYRSLRHASFLALLVLPVVSCESKPLPTQPTPSSPTLPPLVRSSGPLAFVSTRDGSEAIYLANADGSVVTRLTTGLEPAWSPDGRQIAFFEDYAIHVINADGSGLRRVTNGVSPAWSPDGRGLVFGASGIGGISVIDATGSNRREIFDDQGAGAFEPAWSPDGGRIAFSVGPYIEPDIHGLWTVNPDGSEARHYRELHDIARLAWSPDGSEIAFVSFGGIGVVRADGSGRRLVISGSSDLYQVEWTPDSRLMYVRGTWPGPMRIFVNDGGRERQLVPEVASLAGTTYRDWHPVWSK